MRNKLPEESIISTIGTADLGEVAAEWAELGVDALLGGGPLRHLPVVGSIIGLGKVVAAVPDYLLIKKILRFLKELAEVPRGERAKFAFELKRDRQYQHEVGDKLLLLLTRLDDMQKADLLGRFFRAHVLGQITYDRFVELSTALERLPIYRLTGLAAYYSGTTAKLEPDFSLLQDLSAAGLATLRFRTATTSSDISYERNELGGLFVRLGLAR